MSTMKVFLISAKGKQKGTPVPIKIDLFLIGTDEMCQMRSKLNGIGPQHCAVITRERKVFVRDMDSGCRTIVNGADVPPGQEWPLHAGDRLEVGPLEFIVQFNEKALSQRDMEEWALKCLDTNADKGTNEVDPAGQLNGAAPKPINAASAAASILDKLQAKRGVVKGRLRIGVDHGITAVKFNDVHLVDESELALVRRELFTELNKPSLRVLLDFKNVRKMSSTATEIIISLHRMLKNNSSRMAICRLHPELYEALDGLTGRERVRIFKDAKVAQTADW